MLFTFYYKINIQFKMKIIIYTLTLILTLAVSACSSIKVFSEKEAEANLSAYKTYAFVSVPIEQLDQATAILYEEIRKRIAQEMSEKGYKPNTENPDLYVAFNILTEERRKEVTKSTNPYDPYGMYGMWPSAYPWGWPRQDYRYKEIRIEKTGTMVVDLISSKKQEPVWRGIGIGPVNDPEERFETSYKIVKKLFKEFPS